MREIAARLRSVAGVRIDESLVVRGDVESIEDVIRMGVFQLWRDSLTPLLPQRLGALSVIRGRGNLLPTLLWKARKGGAKFEAEFLLDDDKRGFVVLSGVSYAGVKFKDRQRHPLQNIGPPMVARLFDQFMGDPPDEEPVGEGLEDGRDALKRL